MKRTPGVSVVKRKTRIPLVMIAAMALAVGTSAQDRVQIANGILEGTSRAGVRSFKGIPFAEPPVGELR